MVYYKSFDDKLQGKNNFQYEINGIYDVDHDDDWEWIYYSQYISSTLIHSSRTKKIRVCIVQPLGKTMAFKSTSDGYNRGYVYSTNKIKILRELSREEILNILIEEKCPFQTILDYFIPPFSYLLSNKNSIRGDYYCSLIARRDDLTPDEKKLLLPKSQYKQLSRIINNNAG